MQHVSLFGIFLARRRRADGGNDQMHDDIFHGISSVLIAPRKAKIDPALRSFDEPAIRRLVATSSLVAGRRSVMLQLHHHGLRWGVRSHWI
jgi:hypothetical protein